MGHSEGLHRRSAGLAGWSELAGRRDGLRGAAGLEMRAMAVDFPVVHGHPNRLPFEGCLTVVDEASEDLNVRGVQRFFDELSKKRGLQATVIQTVGSKGYDGFALIRVSES